MQLRTEAKRFRIYEGSLQERFQASQAKIQIFAGGFANGKTANACIKALQMAKDYEGSNGLIARSTYPKLNDTIRKEFIKWCPLHWVERFPKSQNSENTCYLTNGSQVNFRYVAQQGKMKNESTTSNQLSATYDWIIVDQIDDPEFTFKDLLDLAGRLRGSTPYRGDDYANPTSGPRYLIITCNPTRNWVYKKIVKPLKLFEQTKRMSPQLQQLCDAFDQEDPRGLIELYEGSTYENVDNLPKDYIKLLEGLYQGQMRDRFLLGLWHGYEGLVYPQFDDTQHVLPHSWAVDYLRKLQRETSYLEIVESYDHGLAQPSCYEFGFVDFFGNVIILDGFYEKEQSVEVSAGKIKQIRRLYLGTEQVDKPVLGDPSIFRRGAGEKKVVGIKVSDMFRDEGVNMQRGNNDIVNGIAKVQSYMNLQPFHRNPMTGDYPAPRLYVSDKLQWWTDEIDDYYWAKDTDGEPLDKPQDHNDHAMDGTKYLLSLQPKLSTIALPPRDVVLRQQLSRWHEQSDQQRDPRGHRHGRSAAA